MDDSPIPPLPDYLALQRLKSLRSHLKNALERTAPPPYPTEPGDFGQSGWQAISAANGLHDVEFFRNAGGAEWLSRQPPELRAEVDEAAAELEALLADASVRPPIAMSESGPADPFQDE